MNLLMTAKYTNFESDMSQILCMRMKKYTLEAVGGLNNL